MMPNCTCPPPKSNHNVTAAIQNGMKEEVALRVWGTFIEDPRCPEHNPSVACTCDTNPGTIDGPSIDCPVHGIDSPDETVPWPVPSEPSAWDQVGTPIILTEERQWENVREFKFDIFEPMNRDVVCLKLIKYEYQRSWNIAGDGYVTLNPHSYVFMISDETNEPYWHEYSGYESFSTDKLPSMDGIMVFTRHNALQRASDEWQLIVGAMNEREDFYRQQAPMAYPPMMTVVAPTADQVQELIDNGGDDVQA